MTNIPVRMMFNVKRGCKGNYYLTIQKRYIIEVLEAILEENKELLQGYTIVTDKDYDPFSFGTVSYETYLEKEQQDDLNDLSLDSRDESEVEK